MLKLREGEEHSNFARCLKTISILLLGVALPTSAASQQRGFLNGGFEANDPGGPGPPTVDIVSDALVPDWSDQTGIIEIWDDGFHGVPAYEGSVFAELNADAPGTLYQDICLVSGETIEWSFAHRARVGSEGANPQTVILEVADPATGSAIQHLAVQNSPQGGAWNTNTGSTVYVGLSGYQRVQFRTSNPGSYENFIDDVSLNLSAFADFLARQTPILKPADKTCQTSE